MSDEVFEIIDGVRRAKAHELLGKTRIPAEIIDEEGNLRELREVDLTSLRVPTKQNLDVSTQSKWERFMKTYDLVKAGSPTPPILITPGSRGQPLGDVPFDSSGLNERS
jgi:hypothetical protein